MGEGGGYARGPFGAAQVWGEAGMRLHGRIPAGGGGWLSVAGGRGELEWAGPWCCLGQVGWYWVRLKQGREREKEGRAGEKRGGGWAWLGLDFGLVFFLFFFSYSFLFLISILFYSKSNSTRIV